MGLMNATITVELEAKLSNMTVVSEKLVKNVHYYNFRVTTKRQDKSFPKTSQQISMEIGGHLHQKFNKPVKLKDADLNLKVCLVASLIIKGYIYCDDALSILYS